VSDLNLDPNTGDLNFSAEDGDLRLTAGRDAIRQRLAMRLRLVRGEWFLDVTAGTDYYGAILGKRTFIEIDAELVRVILTTDGVLSLTGPIEYNVNKINRVLDVSFEVATTEGDLEVDESLTVAT
jgi:hypothetical protein